MMLYSCSVRRHIFLKFHSMQFCLLVIEKRKMSELSQPQLGTKESSKGDEVKITNKE